MVIEEGSTRDWPQWTIHQRRASRSLNIEVSDVMEKGKWMFECKISIMPWRNVYIQVLIFIKSRNQCDMDKKTSLDWISQRNSLSPAQDKVAQVKIMLIPSNFDKDEKLHKEESSRQAQAYFYVFYFSLEYRSSYYKEGCNMMILTKPKCSKHREILRVM
jgi:hypothetical protein